MLLQGKLEVHLGVLFWTIKDKLRVISVEDKPSILGNKIEMQYGSRILVRIRTWNASNSPLNIF